MQYNQQQQRQLPPLPNISNQSSQPIYSYQAQPQLNRNSSIQSLSLYGSKLHPGESQSMQSMQSMESSEAIITQSLPNQTFPVVYNDTIFMVDPVATASASLKFKELIDPLINDNQQLNNARIIVVGNEFTNRNIENFLKLCQNLPTDVHNDEMKEICEIAKMFKADQIYNTGLKFIQDVIDPSFNVPDDKYDESNGQAYVYVELQRKESNESNKPQNDVNDGNDVNGVNDVNDVNDVSKNNNVPQKAEDHDNPDLEKMYGGLDSVVYQVKIENRGLKCPIYRFYIDENLKFSAKKKDYHIYIVEGDDIHVKRDKCDHIGHIHQYPDGFNMIRANDTKFKLQYVNSGKPDELSISVSFPLNDARVNWTPKTPKYDPLTDKYYLNFNGNYHHSPIKSSRNIVLQNSNGHSTFIVRKMDPHCFEIECLPVIDPLIAFGIGLSDIVGPYSN